MKKKFALLCTSVAVAGVVFAGTAQPTFAAACNDGTSQARDYTGSPDPNSPDYNPNYGQVTHEDDLGTTPNGTLIYGDGAEENLNPGYLGATGSTGYIEISGNNDANPNVQIDGASSNGAIDGRVGVDTGNTSAPADACINGTEIL